MSNECLSGEKASETKKSEGQFSDIYMNKRSYRKIMKMDLAMILVFFFSLLLHNTKGEFFFNCNFTFFGISMRMEHYLRVKFSILLIS